MVSVFWGFIVGDEDDGPEVEVERDGGELGLEDDDWSGIPLLWAPPEMALVGVAALVPLKPHPTKRLLPQKIIEPNINCFLMGYMASSRILSGI